MKPRHAILGLIAAVSLIPLGAQAQSDFGVSFGLQLAAATARSESPNVSEQLSGILIGGEVSVSWWRLLLDLRYLDGSADPEVSGVGRDVVEGEVMLGVRPVAWLALKVGPHARSYVMPEGTQRWLYWETRIAAQSRLGTPALRAYFEGWTGIASRLDVAEVLDRAQGLEGGLRLSPAGSRVWAKLAYRMDYSRLGGGVRHETMEYGMVGVGLALGAR